MGLKMNLANVKPNFFVDLDLVLPEGSTSNKRDWNQVTINMKEATESIYQLPTMLATIFFARQGA